MERHFWLDFDLDDPEFAALAEAANERKLLLESVQAQIDHIRAPGGLMVEAFAQAALDFSCHLRGARGDLAQWVWAFEAPESERELLRRLETHVRFALLALQGVGTLGGISINLEFFDPGQPSARMRQMSRAFWLALLVAQCHPRDPLPFEPSPRRAIASRLALIHRRLGRWEASPLSLGKLALACLGAGAATFALTGSALACALAAFGSGAALGALIFWAHAPGAPWRRELAATLARAYPKWGQQGLFADIVRGGHFAAPEQRLPTMKRALDQSAQALGALPLGEAEALANALLGRPRHTPWPTRALRAAIERLNLSSVASSPEKRQGRRL